MPGDVLVFLPCSTPDFLMLSYLVFSRQILASVCVLTWSRTGGQNLGGGGHFLSICDIFGFQWFSDLARYRVTYCFHCANRRFHKFIVFRIINIMLILASRMRVCATPSPRLATCSKGQSEEQKNFGRSTPRSARLRLPTGRKR